MTATLDELTFHNLKMTNNTGVLCLHWALSGHRKYIARHLIHVRFAPDRTSLSAAGVSTKCEKQTFLTTAHNRLSPLRFRPVRMCSGMVTRAGVSNTPDRATRIISD